MSNYDDLLSLQLVTDILFHVDGKHQEASLARNGMTEGMVYNA